MTYLMLAVVGLISMMLLQADNYQNFQIMGVTLAPQHARSDEVKVLLRRFKFELIAVTCLFIVLLLLSGLHFFRAWIDFIQIILLFSFTISAYFPMMRLQKALVEVKHRKGWVYAKEKRVADLAVSREKGKAAPNLIWVWLVWLLSWLPLIIALVMQLEWAILVPLIMVPIFLLALPLSYPVAVRSRALFVSQSSQLTQVYMRRYERINGVSYLLMAMGVSHFFIVLTIMTFVEASIIGAIVLLIVFMVLLIMILLHAQKQRRRLQAEFVEEDSDLMESWQLSESQSGYKWGFYYNPEDYRLFVPKAVSGLGVTINLARPLGKLIMGLVIALVIVPVLFMSRATIDLDLGTDTMKVEAPLYGIEVDYDAIQSIELSQSQLKGRRTNGYGGQDKRFGFFTLDEYGPVRLYVYNDNPYHIDILLEDDHPKWLIINQNNQEETEQLYKELVDHWND